MLLADKFPLFQTANSHFQMAFFTFPNGLLRFPNGKHAANISKKQLRLDVCTSFRYSDGSHLCGYFYQCVIMSTYFPSGKGLAESRKWLVVDAKGKTVGRLATEVARILSGKNNPAWTPFMDMGDHCVVINARHAVFTGAKDDQKIYYRHTLYPGGLRETTVKEMFEKKPEKVIELAVKGMLPKTKLGKAMAKKLKVYADAEHRHLAQKPEAREL